MRRVVILKDTKRKRESCITHIVSMLFTPYTHAACLPTAYAPHTNASIMKLASRNIHASLPESVGGSENSCRPSPSPSVSTAWPSSSPVGDGGRVVAWLSTGGALPARASAVDESFTSLAKLPWSASEPSGVVGCSSIDERLIFSSSSFFFRRPIRVFVLEDRRSDSRRALVRMLSRALLNAANLRSQLIQKMGIK